MKELAESHLKSNEVERFQKLLEKSLDQLSASLPSLDLKSSRKHIHDLRILSRRLRAFSGVLVYIEKNEETAFFHKSLRDLTRILGAVRSCDVSHKIFKEKLDAELSKKAKELYFVEEYFQKERKKLRSQLLKDVAKYRLLKLTRIEFRRKLDVRLEVESFKKAIERRVRKASMNLLKSWRYFCHKTTLSRLHEVRIDLKKWRYLLELKEECLGANLKNVLEPLRKLQEHLGDIHDLEVLLNYLGKRPCQRIAAKKKLKKEWADFLAHIESEIERKVTDFYNEGEHYLVQLLPMRSL